MNRERGLNAIGGLVLIGLGVLFLFVQLFPGLGALVRIDQLWPLIVVAVGAGLLALAVVTRTPPLAIPASIVGGIGLLLFFQNATGYWDSWAFAWTLIPGFVGVGLILRGLLAGELQQGLQAGSRLLAISFVLLIIFGTFLGPFDSLRRFWPVLVILVGFLLLGRSLWQGQRG